MLPHSGGYLSHVGDYRVHIHCTIIANGSAEPASESR